jgi:hypothetical protein
MGTLLLSKRPAAYLQVGYAGANALKTARFARTAVELRA